MAKSGTIGKQTFGKRRKGKAHKKHNKHNRKERNYRGQGKC